MSRSRIVRLDQVEQFSAINVLSDPGAIGGPVVIPQCAEIGFFWTLDGGKTAHNVLHGRYSAGFAGTSAQANAIMSSMTTGTLWTNFAAFLGTGTALAAVWIRDLNVANQPQIVSSNAAVPGTSASPLLPNEVSIAATFTTPFRGPRYRGRMYIPGFATNALASGNVVAAACLSACSTWSKNIPTAFLAQGYTHVLGQRARASYTGSTGTFHPADPAKTTAIDNIFMRDNHWDSQRRRGLK